MAILNRKLQASTLVEVIVAMLIILICFGLALTAIDSNSKSINTKVLILAHQTVLKEKQLTIKEKRYLDEEFTVGNLRIQKTILEYPASAELKELQIQAFDVDGNLLLSNRELIIAE